MKRSEIKIDEVYAVVTGGMYEGAWRLAEFARVLEIGVAVDNFNHGSRNWSRHPSSTTTDGVRVEILNRETLEPTGKTFVVKTRNVIDTWANHRNRLQAVKEREQAAAQRQKDTAEDVKAWAAKLGISEYQMPSLGGGIRGGEGWDSEYTRNRAALVRVLELAYEMGRKDAASE